jgi:UDP-GlcNAc:undecaprenyl-phosphate GlcNAc-1-phosphate transferase
MMWVLFGAASIAFVFSLIATPLVRRLAAHFQLLDRPDAFRKLHAQPVPRIGGLAIVAGYSLALAFVIFAPFQNPSIDVARALSRVSSLIPAVVVIFMTGLLDDLIGLKPWQKLVGQIAASLWAAFHGFGIHLLPGTALDGYLSPVLTVIWLVGCANALNFIDGMDGLAAGIGFFAAVTTLVVAVTHQNFYLALVTAPLAGSLLGFLRYNFSPASIFLGDSGSLLVGFLLGCYGVLWSQKSATILGMFAPLIVLGIPLLDAVVSIVRRFLRSRPIFAADREHIHHRLLDHGLTPRRAALLLYAFCGLAAAMAVLQDSAQNRLGGLIVALFCAAAWLGVQRLGYPEFGVAGKLMFPGALRETIDLQVRLQELERTLIQMESADDAWRVLVSRCHEFGFDGMRMRFAGRDYAHNGGPRTATGWQLRIPLPDEQYVNLYHDRPGAVHAVVLTHFADVIRNVFTAKSLQQAVTRG